MIDRIVKAVHPRPVRGFAPPPTPIAPDLWSLERRLRMTAGVVLPSRTTIIRLRSRGLLVVSPPPLEAGGLDEVRALGAVEEIFVPNSFHYLYAREFLALHPRAVLRTAPGLHARIPSLPAGDELGDGRVPSWDGVVDHAVLGPVHGNAEVALFHRASATLVLTDVAFHMVRFVRPLDRLLMRLAGVPSGFGPSRTGRLLLLRDREATARFLARVLTWPFGRVLVAHGDPLVEDARGVFRRAFARFT